MMHRGFARASISSYLHVPWDDVERVPFTVYNFMLQNALQIGTWQGGGEPEWEDVQATKRTHLEGYYKLKRELAAKGINLA